MNWLTLEQAAQLLRIHPVTLKRKAHNGEIPGAKPGQEWVFLEEHLAEWMRTQYAASSQGLQSDSKEEKSCRSTKEAIQKFGGLGSLSMESEYSALVERPTGRKRRSSTTA